MSRIRRLAAFVAGAALALSACGGSDGDKGATDTTSAAATEATGSTPAGGTEASSESSPDVATGGTLTVGTLNFPSSFAVSSSEYGNMNLYYQAVYDGLLRPTPDGELQPWLATEWSYNDDLTVLTMTLRDDVTFTDGTKFDAAAAVANLERFPTGASPDASNLSSMASAKAVDATTLEITLSAPDPAFLNYLARNAGLMESPAAFDGADEATTPVGSGPYTIDLSNTVAESVYTFVKNPDYWAPETVHYDTLVLKPIADPTAMVNAIKAGELNAAALISADTVSEVQGAGWDLHDHQLDWAGLTLVDRDGSMGSPLDDVKVRQALNMAFDRQAILDSYGAGRGEVTTQVFPVASAGYDEALDAEYPYDPEAAKALLAEAGYPDGFELAMPSTSALGEAVYAIITDSLAQIGVTAVHTDVAPSDFFGQLLAPKYPAYLMFLEQSPNDWQFINFLISATAVWNPSHYTDETSADLISQIQLASDADRPALVKQLGAYIHEQAWFVPWYRITASYATDTTVDVTHQSGNTVPYLWNFVPQS